MSPSERGVQACGPIPHPQHGEALFDQRFLKFLGQDEPWLVFNDARVELVWQWDAFSKCCWDKGLLFPLFMSKTPNTAFKTHLYASWSIKFLLYSVRWMQPFLITYCVSATLLTYLILLWFNTVVRVCIGEKTFTYELLWGQTYVQALSHALLFF